MQCTCTLQQNLQGYCPISPEILKRVNKEKRSGELLIDHLCQGYVLGFPKGQNRIVSLSRFPFVPGQLSFLVPLSRDKSSSKNPGTNSSVPGHPKQNHYLIGKKDPNLSKKNCYIEFVLVYSSSNSFFLEGEL